MVGWLVQDEQIRVARREPREREPASLPAREDADGLEDIVAAEEEAGEMIARVFLVHRARATQGVDDRFASSELAWRLREDRDAGGRRRADVALERAE